MRRSCTLCSRTHERPASNLPRSSAYRHRVVSAGSETWSSVESFEATAPTSTPRFLGSHSRSLPPCSWSVTCAATFKLSRRQSHSSPVSSRCTILRGPSTICNYLLRVAVADLASYEIFHADRLTALPGVPHITSYVVMSTLR